jgi:hypothetical protein
MSVSAWGLRLERPVALCLGRTPPLRVEVYKVLSDALGAAVIRTDRNQQIPVTIEQHGFGVCKPSLLPEVVA